MCSFPQKMNHQIYFIRIMKQPVFIGEQDFLGTAPQQYINNKPTNLCEKQRYHKDSVHLNNRKTTFVLGHNST